MSSALTINIPFEWQASAIGGTPPYTWSATGLPTGLSINSSTGLISGTPTAAGTFNATITVTDDNSDTANDTASFTVQGVPVASPHYAFVEKVAALVRQWGALIAAVPTTETMAGLTRQWGSMTSRSAQSMAGLTRQWGAMTTPVTGLNANLLAWWKFNNTLDDESSNNLTLSKLGSGSTTYISSPLDNAASFTPSNYVLSVSDTVLDNIHTSGFYIAVVFQSVASNGTFQYIFAQDDRNNDDDKWACYITSGGNYFFLVRRPTGFSAATVNGGPVSFGSWILLEAYFDPSVGTHGEIGLAINNAAFTTSSLSAAINTIPTSTTPIFFGGRTASGAYDSAFPLNGYVDMGAIWDTVFSDLSPTGPERADLWNGGNFRADP